MIRLILLMGCAIIAGGGTHSVRANEYNVSRHLSQVRVDNTIQAFGNFGRGITIGVVDTGVRASHQELAGRVFAQSACVATGNCQAGFSDTNGHGTFVASIAAGALNSRGMVGVAPNANILAVKIAQPNGSAFLSDMNRGIVTAAQRGAHVINLSYTTFFRPQQHFAYETLNRELVQSINQVAALNSTLVIAGGNSNVTFLGNVNQGGFSAGALKRLLFVGSVNSQNQRSSFSNTPGTTRFFDTQGRSVALSSLWIMAPGENLVGASHQGDTLQGQGSGTSFAAPVVAGALALLEARWPVLYHNGTAADVLLQTATDLGAPGVDSVFGVGLLDMNRAFLPIGNLNVYNTRGQAINVTTVTASTLTSGSLGALPAIRNRLQSMNSFDNFGRNFTVDLSGLIASRPTAARVALARGTQIVGSRYNLAGGGGLSFMASVADPIAGLPTHGQQTPRQSFAMAITNSQGETYAGGYGAPASASFAEALWGAHSMAAENVGTLGISNSIMDLSAGGGFAVYGLALGGDTRAALSFSQTDDGYDFEAVDWQKRDSQAFGVGATTRVNSFWTAGVTVNALDETDGLLGSTYADSPLSFGKSNQTFSWGLSSAFDIGPDASLVLEAALARSAGGSVSDSLINQVSALYARSYGASFQQRNFFKGQDRLSLSVKKPLKVYDGSASLSVNDVDSEGALVNLTETVDLTPDGSETSLGFTYDAPLEGGFSWNTTLQLRHEADNIRGNHAAGIRVGLKLNF